MRQPHLGLTSLCSLLLALACHTGNTVPHAGLPTSHAPRVEDVDAEHYALDLRLMPETRELAGTCRVHFVSREDGVDSITLDLEALEASAAREVGGGPLEFSQGSGRLSIELGRELMEGELFAVEVDYGGVPLKGLWFVEDEAGEVSQVFTQGECVDARAWYPCFDYPADKATSELRVELPANWIAIAAGERIDQGETANGRFEHWRITTPHSTYLTTLCAGEFHMLEGEWDGIPLTMYADERFEEWMPASFAETDEILAFFSEVTGRRYPYAKYAQTCVGNFPFGGMENISATTMTHTTLTDEMGQRDGTSHGLVAHEAAHQWFGDLLTCATWSEIWLNEGFATYFTQLYYEHSRGVDEFRARMRDTQLSYTGADIGKSRRPTVHNVYRDPFDLFFGGHAYPGGASRLHYLRFVLGDEAFFAGIRRYVADHAGRAVETDDLRVAMETASGRDLEDFFDQWLHKAGYPELRVNWSWDEQRKLVLLEVEQVQLTERGTPYIFDLEVNVELRVGSSRELVRLELDQRKHEFELPAAAEPVWVRFDKYGWLPARIASKKKGPEWVAIAAEDDDVNGRRDAAEALGLLLAVEEEPVARQLYLSSLISRLRNDEQPAVRRAAVEALGKAPQELAGVFLKKVAQEDEDASVRALALKELSDYGQSAELAKFAQSAYDGRYSWNVMIAAAGLYAAANPLDAHAWLLARLETPSPHGRLQAGLVQLLSNIEDPLVIDDIKLVLANEDMPSAARVASADALGRRAKYDREARDLLLALLEQPDYRLRQAGIQNLGRLKDDSVIPILRRELSASVHSRERRSIEEAIESLEH